MERSDRIAHKKIALRNLTDGQISLNVEQQDRADEDDHFSRFQLVDSKLLNSQIGSDKTTTYLQNLRTGDFTKISENYLVREPEKPKIFTSDSFETEMYALINDVTNLIYKTVFFFQGILAGLCLLQVLVLNLSKTSFSEQIVRIDQCIRIASFVSAFGSFYIFLASLRRYHSLTNKANANQLNEHRKFYLQSIIAFVSIRQYYSVYLLCYIFVVIAHEQAVKYNIEPTLYEQSYNIWNILAIIYTAFSIIGWIVSVNAAKSPLELQDNDNN